MRVPPHIDLLPFKIFLLTDGLWRNDGGCFFGVVPRELWKHEHPPDDRNRIRVNLTCPLIASGKTAVLVDTGIGNRLRPEEREIFSHQDGILLDGLRAIGMEPGDVTHVVLSHLHFDHCGGVVRRSGSGGFVPAFPRARYIVQRGEVEQTRSSNERLRAAYRHTAECLDPLAGQLELVDGKTELVSGIESVPTGGHTPDHQVTIVRGRENSFIHLADIVPTRSHLKPGWNQAYDLDPLKTMDAKARYLRVAAAESWWISFAHDDRMLAAKVRESDRRFVVESSIPVDDK